MGLTSPKRTDASLVKLGGNDPSAHQNQRSGPPKAIHRVTQSVSDTPPPDHLSDQTKALWEQWVATASWLAPSDIPSLTYLCELMDRLGELRANPSVPHSSFNQIEALIARFMGQLGLTPASRIQLGLAQVEAETKLELFLAASNDD